MKEHPIIFTENIKAILDGRKTQTRRVIKPAKTSATAKYFDPELNNWPIDQGTGKKLHCPYGQVGDRLWVRETIDLDQMMYVADKSYCEMKDMNWYNQTRLAILPSIFMPHWASRITLEITGVRVERLQEMPAEDILKEGIELPESGIGCDIPSPPDAYENWPEEKREEWIKGQARATYFARCADVQMCFEAFEKLWDSINAKSGYGWSANPWVWVIEFKRVDNDKKND